MSELPLAIGAVDYHTAGEPFRIVSGGLAPLPGRTILEKRRHAMEHLDRVRQLLIFEPRGHADMYGCFVTAPEDEGAQLGVVFFHNAGYSTACGHGTIALVTWALESGVIPMTQGEQTVTVDAPSGRLRCTARCEGARVRDVRFVNVPSYVAHEGLEVPTSRGPVRADVSFGGAFYASVDADPLGLALTGDDLPELIRLGREIKAAIEGAYRIEHPVEPELRDVYGVIFHRTLGEGPELRQRNVTIFADGEVDRSPCGSGTSARLALLDRSGRLPRGARLEHEGITGAVFQGRVVGDGRVAAYEAVITEVTGSAYLTGYHQFVLQPDDPLGTGFLLR